jgi:queuosine precursor transporter
MFRELKELTQSPWKMGIITIMAYLSFQIFADIMALKQIAIGPLVMSPVFFVFPATFTFRDMIHKALGKSVAHVVIVTALIINFVMLGLFRLYISIPPAPGSESAQAAIELVFGSVWRIVLASIVAEFVSQMIDTEVYAGWVKIFGQEKQWGRVFFSNLIAGPVDIIVFKVVAFAGLWPTSMLFANLWTEFFFRFGLALIGMPLIYLVPATTKDQLRTLLGKRPAV